MEALFTSGRIADAILALLLAEALALAWWRRRTGRGIATTQWLPFLVAGAALLLALRAGLTGAWWGWIGLWLAIAGLAHLADLRARWPR